MVLPVYTRDPLAVACGFAPQSTTRAADTLAVLEATTEVTVRHAVEAKSRPSIRNLAFLIPYPASSLGHRVLEMRRQRSATQMARGGAEKGMGQLSQGHLVVFFWMLLLVQVLRPGSGRLGQNLIKCHEP